MRTNLIFDLDGTLWNTEKSYYYAFLKFFEKHPELSRYTSIDNVKLFKGITMDKMAPKLFPNDSSDVQHKKIIECLKYSCEYLIKQEEVNEEIVNNNYELIKHILTFDPEEGAQGGGHYNSILLEPFQLTDTNTENFVDTFIIYQDEKNQDQKAKKTMYPDSSLIFLELSLRAI